MRCCGHAWCCCPMHLSLLLALPASKQGAQARQGPRHNWSMRRSMVSGCGRRVYLSCGHTRPPGGGVLCLRTPKQLKLLLHRRGVKAMRHTSECVSTMGKGCKHL